MCVASISSFCQCDGYSPGDPPGCTYLVKLTYFEDTGEIVSCQVISKSCPPTFNDESGGGSRPTTIIIEKPIRRPNCNVTNTIRFRHHDPVNVIFSEHEAYSGNYTCDGWVSCESYMTSKLYNYDAEARKIKAEVCKAPDLEAALLTVEDRGSNATLYGNVLKSQYIFVIRSTLGFSLGTGRITGAFSLYEDESFLRKKPTFDDVMPLGCYPLNNGKNNTSKTKRY